MSCSTSLPKSPDRIAQPHSRSGRAHALETLSLIAAHNRCASGVRAALPSYPFPRLTLTSGMSQFGPASGSLKETRGHIMTVACKRGLSVYLSHFPPPRNAKAPTFPPGPFLFIMPPLKVKAAYQSRLKYDAFNPVLQDLSQNLSPFVVNVIA